MHMFIFITKNGTLWVIMNLIKPHTTFKTNSVCAIFDFLPSVDYKRMLSKRE